jgi:hypothetical protein
MTEQLAPCAGESESPCGTYAGYQRHLRRDEPSCQPCRDAAAAYQREWRSDPAHRRAHRSGTRARSRALWRLARLYPEVYRSLVADELSRERDR